MRAPRVVPRPVSSPVGGMRRVGPRPYRSRINVHELALGVIANSTSVERERRVAQQRSWDAVDAKVNRLGYDVLRVLSGVRRSAGTQFIVRLLGAIAGEHVDDAIRLAEFREHGV